jgi:hypothetical protein
MKRSRFTETRIVLILKEADTGVQVKEMTGITLLLVFSQKDQKRVASRT